MKIVLQEMQLKPHQRYGLHLFLFFCVFWNETLHQTTIPEKDFPLKIKLK